MDGRYAAAILLSTGTPGWKSLYMENVDMLAEKGKVLSGKLYKTSDEEFIRQRDNRQKCIMIQ